MKNFIFLFFISVISCLGFAQEGRNISEYNLDSTGTGFINGSADKTQAFDPVSVFEEGGGVALKGKETLSTTFKGVTYQFANEKNKKTFSSQPQKYEPTYGGWCARAMVVGQKVHINTKYFTVVGNRSYFFVNSRAKKFFDRDISGNSKKADKEWEKISGEKPRL